MSDRLSWSPGCSPAPNNTLVDLLRWSARDRPDWQTYTFLEDGETAKAAVSNRDLDRQARAIATRLQDAGSSEERVLLMLPPGLLYIAAFFGCLYAGAMAVPVYPPRPNRRSQVRLQAIAADAQPKFVLATHKLLAQFQERETRESLGLESSQWIAADRIDLERASQWKMPRLQADSLAFIQYTSGSTAAPKGVTVSHHNLMHNLGLIYQHMGFSPQTRTVTWLPPYHDMGLIGGLLEPLYAGSPTVLMSPVAFLQQPVRWLRAISEERATISGAPNFAYELCLERVTPAMRGTLDLSCWEVASNGAEPVRAQTIDRFSATFAECGFRHSAFYPCYGMAEATLFVTGSYLQAPPVYKTVDAAALSRDRVVAPDAGTKCQTLVGCGQVPATQRVAIVDPETGWPCPPDTVGEIWVKGASVARGYWNRPESTAATFQAYLADTQEGPFLRTGDLGFFSDGELFVTGRLKDLIIIRGRNYYPQDIEASVEQAHPALRSGGGAAFSIEVEATEQLVVVCELERRWLRDFDSEAIARAIREVIAERHDLPVYAIALLKTGAIPKTSSGKIQRRACQQGFLDGTLVVVGEWRQPASARNEPEARSVQSQFLPREREIQTWLVERVAQASHLAPAQVDLHQSFASYGIDSVSAVRLSGELEQWLQRRLSPTLLYDYPTIAQLSRRLACGEDWGASAASGTGEPPAQEAIAIVGLGCRFPGAENPQAFWQLLRDGVDAIREVPRDRWDVDAYYAAAIAPGKMTTRWGGFLDGIDRFDAPFFGITPREAIKMDPQQRLLLEVAWEALEAAGQPPEALAGSRVGAFVGTSGSDYVRLLAGDPNQLDAYVGTGNAASIAANRLSYSFNWRGPSLAVDTACSSSLVAVHLACQSLRWRECDLALAGGVNVLLSPDLTIAFSQARLMAADGRCKAFDASADGYVRSEGCGLVVLKRLSDAQRDGDRILAVVRGSAIDQDGRSNGLSAPHGPAQQAVIGQALANAGVAPAQIQYVEAHGTGTALGDPVEMGALQAVFGRDRAPDRPCWIGSVKTNIGHLEAAAGIASLIKVVLALQHREIPPHLHFRQLNPHINLEGAPLAIATQRQPWTTGEEPRLAGVSSFGFGGTNAHAVISEAPTVPDSPTPNPRERPLHLLALSAKSDQALRQLSQRYAELVQTLSHPLADLCFSANTGRSHFSHRLSCVASSHAELHAQLNAFASSANPSDRRRTRVPQWESPKVAFLFSGQGTQLAGMGQQLYETQPTFRAAIERCAAILRSELDQPLLSILYPDGPSETSQLHQTAYTQPALFACEYALAKLWQSWGIQPDAVMGHSLGEYVAACVAGVLSLEAGLRLVAARGRLMQSLPEGGAMVAVAADADRVTALLAAQKSPVTLAALNGPHNTVLAGEGAAVDAIATRLAAAGMKTKRLRVSHGFHSPLMEPILEPFRQVVADIEFAPPEIEGVGNLTGALVNEDWVTPEYWVEHLRSPVQFGRGMETLYARGCQAFLEIGPKPTLLAMGRQCFSPAVADQMQWLASLQPGRADWQAMLESLGALYEAGAAIDWRGFDRDYHRQRMPVPTYPFQRQSYWFAPRDSRTEESHLPAAPQVSHPLLGERLPPLPQRPDDRCWQVRLSRDRLSYLGEHRVWGKPALFLGAYVEMALAAARSAWGEGSYQLQDLQLHRPLFFGSEADCTLQITLCEQADGAANFQARSRSGCGENPSPWVLHATATLQREAVAS